MNQTKYLSQIQSKLISSNKESVVYKLLEPFPYSYEQVYLIFTSTTGNYSLQLPVQEHLAKEDTISICSIDLINALNTTGYSTHWKVFLYSPEQPDTMYRLCNTEMEEYYEKHALYNKKTLYGSFIGSCSYENKNYHVRPYYTITGHASIELISPENRYRGVYITKMTDITLKENKLHLSLQAQKIKDFVPSHITMSLRNSDDTENTTCQFPIQCDTSGKKYLITCEVDLKNYEIRPLNWDIFLDYTNELNEVIHTRITNYSKAFDKKYFMSLFRNDIYHMHSNLIFYPVKTFYGFLAFQCREKGPYDGFSFRIKERLGALAYRLQKEKLKDMNIHLVYEKFCNMAQDNGYYYFKYCMDNDMEKKMGRKIFYVIDKNSPDRDKLASYKDHVIDFMSIKYIAYFLASTLLISSDSKTHAYVWRRRCSIIYQYMHNKRLVFLQHGVTALKRMENLFGKGKPGGCNMFITTSEFEKDIIKKYFGYSDNNIAVTGFARWDVLQDKSEVKREILLMPTWRNWLEEVNDEIFRESLYYKNYTKLLTYPNLQSLLEEQDLTLNFYIHPKFRDYIKEFHVESDRIHLIPFGTTPLNELLMSCKLLITDYSSVCWDVYYQKKPVLFYQFDLAEYEQMHGSYLDMKTELFGPRTENISELVSLLKKACADNFTLEKKALQSYNRYFAYTDNQNSKRICESIMEKGW